MAVFRVAKTRDYIVMSNHHLRDRGLSLKSKGLLSLLLSLPDDWNYSTRGLAAICKEGVESISTALRELENAGYIVRTKLRDAKGRICDTEYAIYEQPLNICKPDSDGPYAEIPDVEGQDTEECAQINNNIPNIDLSNNKGLNIHQSINQGQMEAIDAYRELIKDNIEYDCLCERHGAERTDEIVELMLEVLCSERCSIRINNTTLPIDLVKNRMLKLSSSHVEYVFECLDKNTTKIRNIKNYIIAALYNSPVTMGSYYHAEVNSDFGGLGK